MNENINYRLEMDQLKDKLDRIEHLLQENKNNCDKMSNHIDFIEKLYNYIKQPLFFLTKKIQLISKSENNLQLEEF